MKRKIIKECKKYGYLLDYKDGDFLQFKNENVHEDLQIFQVEIDKELELVSMALIIDLGSWNEAIDSDLNNEKEIMENIKNWISEENLKLVLEWLED